ATILLRLLHCITPRKTFSVSCNFIITNDNQCRRSRSGCRQGNENNDAERTTRHHSWLSRLRRRNRGVAERSRQSRSPNLQRGKPALDRPGRRNARSAPVFGESLASGEGQ